MSSFIKRSYIVLICCLSTIVSQAQTLDCQSFRDGTFELMSDYGRVYIIERKGDTQIEHDITDDYKIEFKVKWLDDCTYQLSFVKVLFNPKNLDFGQNSKIVTVKILETKANSYLQETSMEGADLILSNEITRIDKARYNVLTKDIRQINKAFNGYKDAILNDRGEQAIKYLDPSTITYYEEMVDKITNADSVAVTQMNIMDKVFLLQVRHKASPEIIKAFDGKSLLIYAFENDLVSTEDAITTTLGEVTIDGNFAKARVFKEYSPIDLYFHFYKDSGKWKFNLTSLLPTVEAALYQILEETEADEVELLKTALEEQTGKKVSNDIWHPIK